MENRSMQRRAWQIGIVAAAVLFLMAAHVAVGQEGGSVADKASGLSKATGAGPSKGLYEKLEGMWIELYELGGRTMIFLALASIIGLASVLERAISLLIASFGVRGPFRQVRPLWAQGRFNEIEALCTRKKGITSRLINFIARHREYQADEVNAGIGDLASRYVRRHIRRNYPLAVVAGIAPLLGLLGTILGMIEAFEKVNIAGSMGSAEYLSGAISKALITTAGGLMIAIPALFFYHLYKFLIGVLADTLEGKANEMITEWIMKREAA
jgi:biopolymer transport protein ExbB